MKNTFRYALTTQDYINYEKFRVKASLRRYWFLIIFLFVSGAIYSLVTKNTYMFYGIAAAGVILLCFYAYSSGAGAKKSALTSIKKDSGFFSPLQVTVGDTALEIGNLPQEGEAGTVGVYPYSIMNTICETDNYFYFAVGFEPKILPKAAVPVQMQNDVFRQIRKNGNCVVVNRYLMPGKKD